MNQSNTKIIENLVQGSNEWLEFRKTKITATDSCVIMGASHWKTRVQLYYEKTADILPSPPNERMKRGTDLEPIARELFCIKTGNLMIPKVVVKDWCMASLDGINEWNEILEIKCPGDKDHAIALSGKVPDHYYPQLQHQMYVCDSDLVYYFSFDGVDGVIVNVKRDDKYIEKMIQEEKKFYECLINKTPPDPIECDFIEMDNDLWKECALKWKSVTNSIKELEKQEEELRKELIFLSGESNAKGAGISLCHIQRKGNVEYAKIPELKGVDLEKYRKDSIKMWRIF
jgi:putative phage-type endonuclease